MDAPRQPIWWTNFNTMKPMIPTPAHKDKLYKLKVLGTKKQEKGTVTNLKNTEHLIALIAPQNTFVPAGKKEEEKLKEVSLQKQWNKTKRDTSTTKHYTEPDKR